MFFTPPGISVNPIKLLADRSENHSYHHAISQKELGLPILEDKSTSLREKFNLAPSHPFLGLIHEMVRVFSIAFGFKQGEPEMHCSFSNSLIIEHIRDFHCFTALCVSTKIN